MKLRKPSFAVACYQEEDGGCSAGGPRPRDCSGITGWKQMLACLTQP
ncbi:MAG TPA: hypothetical protein VI997_06110 [Candidatus Thermoplasmatota archaeon]|nr:hypothetical protein [Candidatus Thermoplasmatota archaeon]